MAMLNRPLPMTPTAEKREKEKNRKKSENKDNSDRKSTVATEDTLANWSRNHGANGANGRPMSVQYQNDTLQYGGFDNVDAGSVYGGPPTPRR